MIFDEFSAAPFSLLNLSMDTFFVSYTLRIPRRATAGKERSTVDPGRRSHEIHVLVVVARVECITERSRVASGIIRSFSSTTVTSIIRMAGLEGLETLLI